jgi:hypothetical protein
VNKKERGILSGLKVRKQQLDRENCITRSFLTIKRHYCDQIKAIRWAGHVARMRKKRYIYRALVEKP